MARLPLLESGSPNWDECPDESAVDGCKIKVLRVSESTRRACAVFAEPAEASLDAGASIFYLLPPQSSTAPVVRPSIEAFWSSRRAGPSTQKYFNSTFPRLAVAVLQALEELDRQPRTSQSERVIAAIHLCLHPNGGELGLRNEDNFPSLLKDDSRFEELARRWLEIKRSDSVGARMIATAQNHVDKTRKWFRSLETYQALSFPASREKGVAKLTQTAVYKAIRDAAVRHASIPLLGQVRKAFSDVVIDWEKQQRQYRQPIKTETGRKHALAKSGEEPKIRIQAFDKAKNDLGFSWLPKSWS